ncbi:PASTA domain-containing protein [Symbioplanes lichenis]|uniref:PASTA domain-containing protein n=1 Tax=Symbioplanes lichenis TaxID=1629072 RepID=UPI0027385B7A|nr:PASTA domain-containing protein [Actinoplanes lichenis]
MPWTTRSIAPVVLIVTGRGDPGARRRDPSAPIGRTGHVVDPTWTDAGALPAGTAADPLSFLPLPVPPPVLTELQLTMVTIAALTPELRNGAGDMLTADVACRLPFARSHTTNALNHAEALYDRGLQGQVLAILDRFRVRTPGPVPGGDVLVPDLLGLARSAAREALEDAGLRVRFIGTAGNRTEVVSQDPAGGEPAAGGSAVVVRTGPLDGT